jgi:hypothetical protein
MLFQGLLEGGTNQQPLLGFRTCEKAFIVKRWHSFGASNEAFLFSSPANVPSTTLLAFCFTYERTISSAVDLDKGFLNTLAKILEDSSGLCLLHGHELPNRP